MEEICMDRVNEIIKNEEYDFNLNKIGELEADRKFCRHDLTHFLDVARICMLICMDERIEIDRELIYAAALLHDIGRARQYLESIAHEEASAEIAKKILEDAGFVGKENDEIIEAIREHGNEKIKGRKDLTGVLYRADKLSRKCFKCSASNECHKSNDKKNMWVFY